MPAALDLDLINEHLGQLMEGRPIRMPIYNFKTGVREKRHLEFRLKAGEILLIDSLHGLFEGMTKTSPPKARFAFTSRPVPDQGTPTTSSSSGRICGSFGAWCATVGTGVTTGDDRRPLALCAEKRIALYRALHPFGRLHFNGSLPHELPYHRQRLHALMPDIVRRFGATPKGRRVAARGAPASVAGRPPRVAQRRGRSAGLPAAGIHRR